MGAKRPTLLWYLLERRDDLIDELRSKENREYHHCRANSERYLSYIKTSQEIAETEEALKAIGATE